MKKPFAIQRWLLFVLVAALLTFSVKSASHGQGGKKIYWTEWNSETKTGRVRRAHLEGSYVKDIVTGLKDPRSIAVDTLSRKVYWTDYGTGKIQRADFTGRNIKDIVIGFRVLVDRGRVEIACDENGCKGIAFPHKGGKIALAPQWIQDPCSLTLDAGNGKIYWGNQLLDTIQSADLDGSNIQDLLRIRRVVPESFTIMVGGNKIYWTNLDWETKSSKIQRADLDGSNPEDILTGLRGPKGVALDLKERKIYWIESLGKIRRANLNGSHVEDLTTQLTEVNDLALDLTTGKIYWTAWDPNTNTGKIQRANLNGSRVKDVVTGLGYPLEIALYSPGAYTVTADADKLITIWAKIK